MTPGVPTKVVGACCALAAFVISIIAGLAVDNPLDQILTRAIVSLLIGYVVGAVVGAIGEKTIAEAIKSYKSARPADERRPGAPKTQDAA